LVPFVGVGTDEEMDVVGDWSVPVVVDEEEEEEEEEGGTGTEALSEVALLCAVDEAVLVWVDAGGGDTVVEVVGTEDLSGLYL
jgi:hypothetical protein